MAGNSKIVTVFGSGTLRAGTEHYEQVRVLGSALAERGFAVCSGGYAGVMEAVSRGAKESGGRTIGVTAKSFRSRSRVNQWIDEEIRVATWQDRLFELVKRGHAYATCKGGTGTLVELAVVWEMMKKGTMETKPIVVFGDFWSPVIDCVRHLGDQDDDGLIHVASSPTDVADHLSQRLNAMKSR
jgi:uncharacterized protein (TIGR00730 family)